MRNLMLAVVFVVAATAPGWAQIMETEPNNSFGQANDLGNLNGNIWARGDQGGAGGDDYYLFNYAGGASAVVVRTSGTSGFDSKLDLYNSGQSLLATNDDYIGLHSGIVQTGLGAGQYYVREYPFGSSTGQYDMTIFAHKARPESDGYNLSDLGLNGFMITGFLNPGEHDVYTFNNPALIANMGVWIDSGLDLVMTALGVFNDDSGPGLNPGLEFFNVASGGYSVDISGYNGNVTGAYTLFIEGVPPVPEPASLALLGLGALLLRRR